MLKYYKIIAYLLLGAAFSSCDKLSSILPNFEKAETHESFSLIDFGKVEHYESFLWKDGNEAILDASIVTEFNEASSQAGSFVLFEIQDENGQTINRKDIQISVNGAALKDGSYKLVSSNNQAQQELTLSINFNNQADAKDFKGYLAVKQSNLDRVNDTPLDNIANTKILQWQAQYEPVINPLKFWVIIISSVIAFILFLRLTILKKKIYPVFTGTVRYFESPTQSRSINFNGNRQVVLTNRIPKQGAFDKLWRGKILYINDPLFSEPIELTPKKKGAIKYRFNTSKYAVTPSDGFLQRGTEYKIKSSDSKQTVILK
ncbi:hypothetical protein [Pontibacter sp. BAB1700]|uniref:hypothetical protein n=1 Tax=Pontibacter sp. BAB1700 TaxID=1144253 RepID=UPI00026BD292|nr:hypothetical protein [Pontibacter sp. BAB1700]EJF08504.1 hypothetical protein O71_20402 [Pontibacter sp. BAB1700]